MVTGQQSHAEAFAVDMRNESHAVQGAVGKTKVSTDSEDQRQRDVDGGYFVASNCLLECSRARDHLRPSRGNLEISDEDVCPVVKKKRKKIGLRQT
jgi:hypothetical protein